MALLAFFFTTFFSKAEEERSPASLAGLEETLKKLLDQAGHVPSNASVASAEGVSAEASQLISEINQLKTELETKKKQIEEFQAQAPADASASADGTAAPAVAGLSNEEREKLEAQVKELQGKLSEYEIISEDIADLSFYKEQNAKLQKELEALKGGAATAAAPAKAAEAPVAATPTPPTPVEAPPPPPPEPEIVGKAKATPPPPVEETTAAAVPAAPSPEAPPVAASAGPAEPIDTSIDNDLMAEFDAAVEKQKGSSGSASAAESEAAPAPAEIIDLGTMDMDKMMAEASGITVSDDTPEISAEEALGTGLDENKLLAEAASLGGVSAENAQLMGEFENFVGNKEKAEKKG